MRLLLCRIWAWTGTEILDHGTLSQGAGWGQLVAERRTSTWSPRFSSWGWAWFIFTSACHPGSTRLHHLCRVLGSCHTLGEPGFACWASQLSLGHQTPYIHKVPESRALGWGPRTGSVLQAGSYHTQPGGIWFGPLPAPPPPCAWAEPSGC